MAALPETALWRAVFLQAVQDATKKIQKPKFPPIPIFLPSSEKAPIRKAALQRIKAFRDARRIQKDARNWLTRGGRDFSLVCGFASLNQPYVRMRINEIRDNGWCRRTSPSGSYREIGNE